MEMACAMLENLIQLLVSLILGIVTNLMNGTRIVKWRTQIKWEMESAIQIRPFTGKLMNQLTGECGIDGGNCDSRFPVTGEKVDGIASLYPNCNAGIFEALIGNGRCNGLGLNIKECGWDGGDCVQYNEDYPDCDANWPRNIGNGRCSGKVGGYDTLECKYDGGDCTAFREW